MKAWEGMASRLRCMQTMPILQRYLDGQLDEVASRRVADHLEHCRRCGLEFSVYSEIRASLQRHDTTIASDLLERLRDFSTHLVDERSGASGNDG